MKRLCLLALTILLTAVTLNAIVKPRGAARQVSQSDSTTLKVKYFSDRDTYYFQTDDGYMVSKNEKGDYVYVKGYKDNEYVLTQVIAHNLSQRSMAETEFVKSLPKASKLYEFNAKRNLRKIGLHDKAVLTSEGSPYIPLILVQFQDKKFSCASTPDSVIMIFDKFCNGDGSEGYYHGAGSYGSVNDYFVSQSGGKFDPKFVVVALVTLSDTCGYYGKNSSTRRDVNIGAFYSESLELAIKQYEDWSIFDNNSDGVIDMAYFVYAGEGENALYATEPNLIWPKETNYGGTINGIKFGCYACTNETYKYELDGVGTFVHELSHALGLPDFYNTSSDYSFGMDAWDLMDYGNYMASGKKPVGYSTYQKDFMQWQSLVELNPDEPQYLTLKPVSMGGTGYKIVNKENSNEYYIIENRQNHDWDGLIGYSVTSSKHHGMLVTHVDYQQSYWTSNVVNANSSHQRFTILPADGELLAQYFVEEKYTSDEYLESMGGDPFPGFKDVHFLTNDMSVVFTGSTMGQPLGDIEEWEDSTITLKYCVTDTLETPVIDDSFYDQNITWNEVDGATEYKIIVSTSEDFSDIVLTDYISQPTYKLESEYIDKLIEQAASSGTALCLYIKVQARAELKINSPYSDYVTITGLVPSSVSTISADNIYFSSSNGEIDVSSSCKEINVYNISGVKLAHSKSGSLSVSLPKGTYIVESGNKVKKVIVR